MKPSTVCWVTFVAAAATVLPGVASAQEAGSPPPAVATTETTSQASGPSLWMLGGGLTIFGFAYVPVAVVGATSGLSADRSLFVPLAGPWIDLTQRPGCAPASACSAENSAKVLLVVDGVFQALGALTVLGSFLNTAHVTTTVQRPASLAPTVGISPAQMGTGGYGMVALGAF